MIDHVVGPALIAAPTVLGLGRTSASGLTASAVGGAQTAYSNLTDYELSMKNVVPMRVHLALDAVGGATLALVPALTGRKHGKKEWLPLLAVGVFELGLAALTKKDPPKTTTGRAAKVAKLVATAKLAKETARGAVQAVR